ncbi:MAG: hypothetical protein QXT38_04475 [Candidatus Aenigmatarchaeota archaeon]
MIDKNENKVILEMLEKVSPLYALIKKWVEEEENENIAIRNAPITQYER